MLLAAPDVGVVVNSMLSASPSFTPGYRSASVSANKTRSCALLNSRDCPVELRLDSPANGLRMISIGSVQGGGLLVQLFCTKGNCMLVAPVIPFTTYLFSGLTDLVGKFGFLEPAIPWIPAGPARIPGRTGSRSRHRKTIRARRRERVQRTTAGSRGYVHGSRIATRRRMAVFQLIHDHLAVSRNLVVKHQLV